MNVISGGTTLKKLLILLVLLNLTLPAKALMPDQIRTYTKYTIAPNAEIVHKEPYDERVLGPQVVQRDRSGYYIDERGQVPEYQRIPPPHPEKIPQNPRATRTVEPFQSYYDRNVLGITRHYQMTPVIPNYNEFYSDKNRRPEPYTKQEFIDVWCTGEQHVNGVDCVTENYAITFAKAINWSTAVVTAPFKAKRVGKPMAIFIMVDDLALDGKYMHDVKQWGEVFNVQVWFGTVDSFIPSSWIL